MVAKRDQHINPGIRGVDRVTRGNSGRTFGSTLVSGFLCTWTLHKIAINDMYKKIPVRKLTGSEVFKNSGPKSFNVLEFWQYGFSSLNSNVLRGALAEFLVENALKQNKEIDVRSPWGDYDVLYQNTKIEVKCCSYIQDWDQNQFTKILWSGLKATELYYSDAVKKQSELSRVADYKSDVYVLALFNHQDHATLDIVDLSQWCFYVLSRDHLKELSKNGNSISLARLEKHAIKPFEFNDLAKAIVENTA
jgi:hypothetical protein